jgi:hypothetical protein
VAYHNFNHQVSDPIVPMPNDDITLFTWIEIVANAPTIFTKHLQIHEESLIRNLPLDGKLETTVKRF